MKNQIGKRSSGNDLYLEDFLKGPQESDEDVLKKNLIEVRLFDDFVK